MNNIEEVDRLSREALQGLNEPPPAYIAEKISKRMFWYNLWHYKVIANLKFAIPSLVAIVGLTIVLIWHYGSPNNKTTAAMSVKEIPVSAITTIDVRPALTSDNLIKTSQTTAKTNNIIIPEQKTNGNNKSKTTLLASANNQQNPDQLYGANASISSGKQTAIINNVQSSSVSSGLANDVYVNERKSNISSTSNDYPIVVKKDKINTISNRHPGILMKTPFLPCFTVNDENNNSFFAMTDKIAPSSFKKRPLFDLNLYISPLLPIFGKKDKDITSVPSMPSGSLSLALDYHIKNFILESGLQYSNMQLIQSGNNMVYNPHDIMTRQLTGQQQVINTFGFWSIRYIEVSAIRQIDSTWEIRHDTTLQNVYKSVTKRVYDTLKSKAWKSSISVLEIPLAVGYRFYACKMELSIRSGILIGIVSRTGGMTYCKESSMGIVQMSEVYSTKGIQYGYFISGSIARNLTENWSVELSPSWRSSINGIRGKEGYPSMKYNAWGLGLGIRYEF